jgi:hypothetical protein
VRPLQGGRLALAAAGALVPGLAAACTSCARDQSEWGLWLVAGMIAAPYAVTVFVVRTIRAAAGGEP